MKVNRQLWWSLALVASISHIGADSPLVDAPVGSITGTLKTVEGVQVDSFFGVPYARPPVGELRFSLPAPFGHVGQFNATRVSPMCPQPHRKLSTIRFAEDCLYLDVHRKTGTKQGDDKPVIAILHGGMFMAGSSSDFLVHAVPLAGLGDVVVVSINNRLGILGFADMKNLAPGNLGLLDQRLALDWIQDNIRAFGGNPDRVTLMGVNAGAGAINLHIGSPLNRQGRQLFHAAIMDGGVVTPGVLTNADISLSRIQQIAKTLACETNNTEMVACLRKADADELVTLSRDVEGYSQLFTFHPTADKNFIPGQAVDNESAQGSAKVKVLVGYAKDEGTFLAKILMNIRDGIIPKGNTKAELFELCGKAAFNFKYPVNLQVKSTKKIVADEYYGKTNNMFTDVAAFIGDGSFICPMNSFIRSYSRTNANLYVYRFERKLSQRYKYLDPNLLGAFHSSPFIHMAGSFLGLPTADLNITLIHRKDRAFFRDAIKMVSDFSRSDDSPMFRGVRWPDFSKGEGVMVFDETPHISQQELYNESRCKKVFPPSAPAA